MGSREEKEKMLKNVSYCCSVVSGFGVVMLCVVGFALDSGTELLGPIVVGDPETAHSDAAGRCYMAAITYAIFFCLSMAGIRFGKTVEEPKRLSFCLGSGSGLIYDENSGKAYVQRPS